VSDKEELETIAYSQRMLHTIENDALRAADVLVGEAEKARRYPNLQLNPFKSLMLTANLLHDLSFMATVQEYLLSKESLRLSAGTDPELLQQTLAKVREVEVELKKREKGLNWVDNLLNHTPETGEREP